MVQTDFTPQEVDIQQVEKANEIVADTDAYKKRLRLLPEVQALTNEINIQDVNTIVGFGQKSARKLVKFLTRFLILQKYLQIKMLLK